MMIPCVVTSTFWRNRTHDLGYQGHVKLEVSIISLALPPLPTGTHTQTRGPWKLSATARIDTDKVKCQVAITSSVPYPLAGIILPLDTDD
jgi:hypothetical protein